MAAGHVSENAPELKRISESSVNTTVHDHRRKPASNEK